MAEYHIGSGLDANEPHEFDWGVLQPGDVVNLHGRPEPYASKIHLWHQGVTLRGVPGPDGEQPALTGEGAVEWPGAKYFSDQVVGVGLLMIAPQAGVPPRDITVEGITFQDAGHPAGFTLANGDGAGWSIAAAGVATYRSSNVLISNCALLRNNNGLFCKSYGYTDGDVNNLTLNCNLFAENGTGTDHQHGCYVEANGCLVRGNWFTGMRGAGNQFKDRSAGLVFEYNWVEGGQRLLNLVDPDDGAPSFLQSPLWGLDIVRGNVLYNNGTSRAPVHYGGDEVFNRPYLRFHHNTVITRAREGDWSYACFKLNPTLIEAWCNLFHVLPNEAGWTPPLFPAYTEYGRSRLVLAGNWTSGTLGAGDADLELEAEGNAQGDDPGLTATAPDDLNFRPVPTAPARGFTPPLPDGWELPSLQLEPETSTWVPRTSWQTVGAVEG